MEFAIALNRIWQRRRWLLAVALVALLAGLSIAYQLSVFPPRLQARSDDRGAASTHLLVDSARSSLPNFQIPVESLAGRAQVYAELLRTETVRQRIGEEAGIPWTELFVDGSTTDAADGEPQPSAVEREVELQSDEREARLFFRVDPSRPIIRITTQGKTVNQAVDLAEASALSLSQYIDELQRLDGVPEPRRVEITQLGSANGGAANRSAAEVTGILGGLAIFGIGCLMILFVPRIADSVRRANALEDRDRPRPESERVPLRERASTAAQRVASFVKQLGGDRHQPSAEEPRAEQRAKQPAPSSTQRAPSNWWLSLGGNGGPPEEPVAKLSDGDPVTESSNGKTVAEPSDEPMAEASDEPMAEARDQGALPESGNGAGPDAPERKPPARKAPKRKPPAKKPRARKPRARKPAEPKPAEPKPVEPTPPERMLPERAEAGRDGGSPDS